MTSMFPPAARQAAATPAIVLNAVRCWRIARDAGLSVQPRLTTVLRAHGCEMLAPCFDSVMSLCEAALGRRLSIGGPHVVSADESLLLDLLEGAKGPRDCLQCSDGLATAFDCALCSARILMSLAFDGDRAGRRAPPLPN